MVPKQNDVIGWPIYNFNLDWSEKAHMWPGLQTQPLFLMSSISNFRKHSAQGEIFEFFNLKQPKTLYRRWNFTVLQSQTPKNTLQKVKSDSSSISNAQKFSTDCEIWHFFHLKCMKTLYRRRKLWVLPFHMCEKSAQNVKSLLYRRLNLWLLPKMRKS